MIFQNWIWFGSDISNLILFLPSEEWSWDPFLKFPSSLKLIHFKDYFCIHCIKLMWPKRMVNNSNKEVDRALTVFRPNIDPALTIFTLLWAITVPCIWEPLGDRAWRWRSIMDALMSLLEWTRSDVIVSELSFPSWFLLLSHWSNVGDEGQDIVCCKWANGKPITVTGT